MDTTDTRASSKSRATTRPSVVVIGAGAVGLAAAAHLLEEGVEVTVVEAADEIGVGIRSGGAGAAAVPWRDTLDAASARLLISAGWDLPDLDALPTGDELVERYLRPLADVPALRGRIRLSTQVTDIVRPAAGTTDDRGCVVRISGGSGHEELTVDAVLDTSTDPSPSTPGAGPRFGILGPLRVLDDRGRPVHPGGPRPRELLGLLLLHANSPLSTEHLVEALWGEGASVGAATTLRTHVATVRRILEAAGAGDSLLCLAGTYRLVVAPTDVDASLFEAEVGRAQEALAAGDAAEAARLTTQALSRWRGDVLDDVGTSSHAETLVARLSELRLAAEETAVAAALAQGRHREVLGRLQELVAAHPFHERLAGQLMLALYRSARQADALQVYADTAHRLGEELGLDPSPALQSLRLALLRQDADLLLGSEATPPVRDTRRAPAPLARPARPALPGVQEQRGRVGGRTGRPRPATGRDALPVLRFATDTPHGMRERLRLLLPLDPGHRSPAPLPAR